jgi:hypothetical protein
MSKMTSRKLEARSTVSSGAATHRYSTKPGSPSLLSWGLPSGESLAEFALRFGFLAPRLIGPSSTRVLELIPFREAQ